jgi:hypothetical protein
MIASWLLLWMVFLFIFLLPPIGYGWGYRRWGPPYPRYIQRRRAQRAAAVGGSASFDHYSWGWGGDFVWMMLSIWMIWAVAALFWR